MFKHGHILCLYLLCWIL